MSFLQPPAIALLLPSLGSKDNPLKKFKSSGQIDSVTHSLTRSTKIQVLDTVRQSTRT